MGLSTQVLKPDSLDPDPRSAFNVVLRELHMVYRLCVLHCLTGTHALLRVLSHSTARSADPDRGRVEAKKTLNPEPRSALDSDPNSHVESPNEMRNYFTAMRYRHSV